MNYRLKYLAFIMLPLISLSLPIPAISSPLVAQMQTSQEQNTQALQLFWLGIQQYNQGQLQVALKTFEQVLVIIRKINEPQGEGLTLYQIGLVYDDLGQYSKALEFYQQALIIHKQIKNRDMEGKTLDNIGKVYRKLGEFEQALKFHQQALVIHKQIDNKQAQVLTLNYLAKVYYSTGQHTKALETYQQALALVKETNEPLAEAATLKLIGEVYDQLGQYPKALEAYQQALIIIKKIKAQATEAFTLNAIAGVYDNVGQYAQALESYQQALAIFQQLGNKEGEGFTFYYISQVYFHLGQYAKVLELSQQALAIHKQIGYKDSEAPILNILGLTYKSIGKYTKALEIFEQILAIFQQKGNPEGESAALNNIGLTYRNLGNYPKALEYYQRALVVIKKLSNPIAEATGLNNIGAAYYSLANYAKALEFFGKALAIRKQIGDQAGVGNTLTNIGTVYYSQGKYIDAEKTLFAAIEVWESLRKDVLTDADKISIFETQADSYQTLQQSLIAQNKINSALEVSDRARARAFIELLASKQLEKPSAQLDIKPLTLQQIQNVARVENATLVQYSIIENTALYIWVIKPTGKIAFEQVDLEKSLNTPLKDLVTLSRKSIGVTERGGIIPNPTTATNQTKQLQKLYEILIKPIAPHLPQNANARVIFIPQESLFLVPFPALQDEQGKYLINKHTILTAPAIQVLELTHKQKQNVNKSAKDVLIVGNPTMPKIPFKNEQLIPLPGAEKEAIKIADLFKTQAIIGSKATETAIVPKMSQARIIHFATHGLLDDFKGLGVPGAIAFSPDSQNDGLLTAGEILGMKLNAELVVLSACNTAGGNITGDGVIGLSRSLITAGVPSVIVSLWSVDDNSTTFLMSEFYRNFQQNSDKAVALRQAMLTAKQKYANPLDWAAFTLIGEAD